MRDVSPELKAALRGDHQAVVVVDAWYDGDLVAPDLPVSGGEMTWEWGRPVPSSIRFTVTDETGDLAPTDPTDPLAPYGSEITVRRGARLAGGGVETTPLGWWRVQAADLDQTWAWRPRNVTEVPGIGPRVFPEKWTNTGAQVSVEGIDRLQAVADNRFIAPGQVTVPSSCLEEIRELAAGLLPIGVAVDVIDAPVPGGVDYGEDRLSAMTAIAEEINGVVVTDGFGALVVRGTPTTPTPVDITGGIDGLLVSAGTGWTRDGLVNAVRATGEQSGDVAPVSATAVARSGALRWDGPFGRVPGFFSSPLLTTVARAQSAARTRLQNLIDSRVQTLTVVCAVDTSIEIGDYVRVVVPDRDWVGRVTRQTIPILASGGPMTLQVEVPLPADAGLVTVVQL